MTVAEPLHVAMISSSVLTLLPVTVTVMLSVSTVPATVPVAVMLLPVAVTLMFRFTVACLLTMVIVEMPLNAKLIVPVTVSVKLFPSITTVSVTLAMATVKLPDGVKVNSVWLLWFNVNVSVPFSVRVPPPKLTISLSNVMLRSFVPVTDTVLPMVLLRVNSSPSRSATKFAMTWLIGDELY